MNLPASFFEHMGISAKEWENLKTQVPQAEDPLFWLLKSGQLSADSYFNWAQTEYGCAYLKSEFFQTELATTARAKFGVSEETSRNQVPVAEWDGITFYACICPPEKLDNQSRFFLAHPKAIEQFCVTETVQHTVVQVSTPEPQAPEAPPAFPEFDAEDLSAKADAAPIEMPEGLQGFALPSEEKTVTRVAAADIPAGLVSEDEIPTQVKAPVGEAAPEGFVLNWDSAPPSNETSADVLKIQQVSQEKGQQEITGSKVVPLENAAKTQKASAADEKLAEFESAMSLIVTEFTSSILFRFENQNFQPVNWSPGLKAKPAVGPKNLQEPSAFRIAYRSKQPYLGHMVSTEVNDGFVNAWFQNAPKKVLLQPIKSDGRVIGAFLAVCEGETASHLLLSKAEDLAKQLAGQWPHSKSQAA